MSKLLVKKQLNRTKALEITPETAGWKYVGFVLHQLAEGETTVIQTDDREVLLVLVAGRATVSIDEEVFESIGDRMSPFDSQLPYAVYVPPHREIRVTAATDLELGECSAADAKGLYPVRLVTPETMRGLERGQATNWRYITNILMLDQVAERLLVTEVMTPSGHWSSYPPHKHDTDNLPEESYLEETYYHRIDPQCGFVFQRVYNDALTLNETMSVNDGDCVLVPEGYHPVGVPHGYRSYYLNVMAGPKREWQFRNDPNHEWIVNLA